MGRILTLSLVAAVLCSNAAFSAEPQDRKAFHQERYGKEISFTPAVNQIHWTVNFRDFLDDQTAQLRLEIEKFKPVKFVREAPLSTTEGGIIAQLEPIHYPSVQFSAARW